MFLKVYFVSDFILEHNLDLFGVAETWLLPEVPDSFIAINHCNIVRTDTRGDTRKHGVCIYVRKGIIFISLNVDCSNVCTVNLLDFNLLNECCCEGVYSYKCFRMSVSCTVVLYFREFWERLVLCNSMVWCCELTGRPNLTYLEALECESRARRCLSKFPQLLRRPILYLASLTRRGRFIDLNEDVFAFVRDRYFVGEEVEAIVHNHWYDCKVCVCLSQGYCIYPHRMVFVFPVLVILISHLMDKIDKSCYTYMHIYIYLIKVSP